ncbi:MAG: DUF881 domain-containing protein [Chloroflexi bacterium]|nr:DUF881 domain-containing protein [Chloroflexota bacterium]
MKFKFDGVGRYIPILVIALVFGVLLGLQWKSPPARPATVPGIGHESGVLAIKRLEAEQEGLKESIGQLRGQLDKYRRELAASTEMLKEINAELERQKMIAGLLAVEGPGVQVTLDDSSIRSVSAAADASDYLIHEYDLRDVVNLLWMAGSEAIAVNNERIVATTSIYCVGSTIMVNDTRLSPPYLIQAIGNPIVQEDVLRNPAYLKEIKQRAELYSVQFKVDRQGMLTLPAYKGGFPIHYAQLGD